MNYLGDPCGRPIHIKLRKSSSTSVGARAVGSGCVGLDGRPLLGVTSVTPGRTAAGERATIKAHPTSPPPPSPLRSLHLHFVRLMPIGRPLRSPIHFINLLHLAGL